MNINKELKKEEKNVCLRFSLWSLSPIICCLKHLV